MGIGINLHLEQSARDAIDQPAIGLDEILPPSVVASEREAWIGRLAAAVLETLEVFSREGFAAFRPRFNALMEGRGREVDILDNGRVVLSGRLADVDGYGRLLIDVGSGAPRVVSVGDVSFRDARAVTLLIDAGNSAVKWAMLAEGGRFSASGRVLHRDGRMSPRN